MATIQENPWMSPRKAARRLEVSEMKIYKWALLGQLKPLIEPGENVRVSRESVEKLAKARGITRPSLNPVAV